MTIDYIIDKGQNYCDIIYFSLVVRQQARRPGGDEGLHNSEPGQRGLSDQHARIQLPADAGPAVLSDQGDGESDQPHQPDCLHPQGEGCQT